MKEVLCFEKWTLKEINYAASYDHTPNDVRITTLTQWANE